MVKVKNVVAVAIMFIAAGAMASNFRAADQVYLPAAGHLGGSSGTFISDVFISNLSSDSVSVSVIFSTGAGGTQTAFPTVITLAGHERRWPRQDLHHWTPQYGRQRHPRNVSRKYRSRQRIAVLDDDPSSQIAQRTQRHAARQHVLADAVASRSYAGGSLDHVPGIRG